MISVLFYIMMALANLLALGVLTGRGRRWVRRTLPDWWPSWHMKLMCRLAVLTVLLFDIVEALEAAD